jgi:hypothetical protein
MLKFRQPNKKVFRPNLKPRGYLVLIKHPEPVVEERPVPVVEERPVPVVEERPVPVVEETPVPVLQNKSKQHNVKLSGAVKISSKVKY